MDSTTQKLIHLLDGQNIDLRKAAMRVVTELGIDSAPVIRSLGRALREETESLKILALKGLVRLGASDVAHQVIPLVLEAGEVREHALAVAVAIGAPAIDPLIDLYESADFHSKRTIIAALSRIGGAKAFDFLLKVLLTEPFELQKHISQCLCDAIDRFSPSAQPSIFKMVRRFLVLPRVKKDLQAQVVGLILLGHFHGPSQVITGRKVLRGYAQKKNPPEIRRYALISLSRLIGEGAVGNDLVNFLEACLSDDDWHNVAQHALTAFQRVALSRARSLKLVSLLRKSPHFSVHIHVLERLSKEDLPEISRAIIPFLGDSRFRVREAAEKALRSMPSAIEDLFTALTDSDDTDLCHRAHSILREYPQEVKRRYLDRAISRFLGLYDRNDRRYQFFLDFIRTIDSESLRRQIYQKVDSLRRSKSKDRWLKMSRYLQVLWDQHLITASGRYIFALALIRLNNKDLSPHARRANLGLQVLRSLIYDDTPKLVADLTRSKDLGPEDLFYIGFHFMEEGEDFRSFARALLEHVLEKYSRAKVAAAARQKLDLYAAPAPSAREIASSRREAAAAAAAAAAARGKAQDARPATGPGSARVRATVEKGKAAARTAAAPPARGKPAAARPIHDAPARIADVIKAPARKAPVEAAAGAKAPVKQAAVKKTEPKKPELKKSAGKKAPGKQGSGKSSRPASKKAAAARKSSRASRPGKASGRKKRGATRRR